ncbi:MAG: DUF3568 family protein, partial [Opitutales bacterium]
EGAQGNPQPRRITMQTIMLSQPVATKPPAPSRSPLGQTILALLAFGLAGIMSGCAAVAVGAGTGAAVAYKMGKLESTVPATLPAMVKATDGAIVQLQLAKVSESKDALGANITARTALDKKVEITLSRQTDQTTQVGIRVGIFGDEQASLKILDQIKSSL